MALPKPATTEAPISSTDWAYRAFVEGRLLGMRDNRYSWWCHWRELADYFLPRRYKWIVMANQQNRGSPIQQHIIDASAVRFAQNLAAGLMTGKTPPTRPWAFLTINKLDSTGTTPVSLWLANCERLMHLIFAQSNFYQAIATFFYDLVIFGTAVIIIYEDYDNVIKCYNPCAGEFYLDIDGKYRPCIMYREFTMTIAAIVDEFGFDACPLMIQNMYTQRDGANLTKEYVIAHAIEPNDDGRDFGIPTHFKFRECYWVWGGSTNPQNHEFPGFLRKRGYHEQCAIAGRWDLVSNDPYGRCPAMDGLGDQKQLQLETKRKAQAIDKMVNPPLVADIQLKNKPASQLPGGVTFVTGFSSGGRPGIASIYDTKFPVNDITADLAEIRERLKMIFFNDLFQPISQFETRSNVTAVEIDQRKSEALIMLGPVFERLDNEVLRPIVERVFAMMTRAGILPPAPPEIAGMELTIEFESMLAIAQNATQAGSIERVLSMVGQIAALDPGIMAKVDFDFTLDNYSQLLENDPRMMRSDAAAAQIRQKQQQQQEMMQRAQMAEQMAGAAKNLAGADVGDGTNALQAMTGGQGQ